MMKEGKVYVVHQHTCFT